MKPHLRIAIVVACASLLVTALGESFPARAAEDLPPYLRDRGTGVATSMFGTYVRRGELLVYPFFEYYVNGDEEYSPEELGYDDDADYRGRYRASEALVFLGYGITDDLAVELEAGVIDATLETADDDLSGAPDEISESGINDVEGQVRWRLLREGERRPEVFSFLEVVFPVQKDRQIIGTPDWEFKLGAAAVKGFDWGTLTVRAAVAYTVEESAFELGEYAVEYLKRLAPDWKIYFAVEGDQDEVEAIPEVQWTFRRGRPSMTLKLNSAFGLTSKAADWAPEIGVVLAF